MEDDAATDRDWEHWEYKTDLCDCAALFSVAKVKLDFTSAPFDEATFLHQ